VPGALEGSSSGGAAGDLARIQAKSRKPSLRYLAVQQFAIGELAFKPFDEEAAEIAAPYLLKAAQFRTDAIMSGEGDPLVNLTTVSPRL